MDAHILFGSHGVGSVELERMPIMHGRQWASSATLENKPALLCNIHSPEVGPPVAPAPVHGVGWGQCMGAMRGGRCGTFRGRTKHMGHTA